MEICFIYLEEKHLAVLDFLTLIISINYMNKYIYLTLF